MCIRDRDKIYHAAFVLRDVARRTDLIAASRLNSASDLYLKTENLQVTGSFKAVSYTHLDVYKRQCGQFAVLLDIFQEGRHVAGTPLGGGVPGDAHQLMVDERVVEAVFHLSLIHI